MKLNLTTTIQRVTAALCVIAFALVATGCATTATKSENMVISSGAVASGIKHPGSVAVNVEGGSETSSLGVSQISNQDFALAIVTSIQQMQLFQSVGEDDTASDFVLRAFITDVEQPLMGFSMTVKLDVAWSLLKRGETTPVWSAVHTSEYTASAGAAFAGVERVRMATEGAGKENIEWALGEIAGLDTLQVASTRIEPYNADQSPEPAQQSKAPKTYGVASQLRAVTADNKDDCEFIKSITRGAGGSGNPSKFVEDAMSSALTEAASHGADSYFVVNTDTTDSGATVVLEALRCN